MSDTEIIYDNAFAKNALLNVGGGNPYKGLLGQVPNLLRDFESPTTTMENESKALLAARRREISLQSMIQHTAEMRLRHSLESQSRPAGESLQLA